MKYFHEMGSIDHTFVTTWNNLTLEVRLQLQQCRACDARYARNTHAEQPSAHQLRYCCACDAYSKKGTVLIFSRPASETQARHENASLHQFSRTQPSRDACSATTQYKKQPTRLSWQHRHNTPINPFMLFIIQSLVVPLHITRRFTSRCDQPQVSSSLIWRSSAARSTRRLPLHFGATILNPSNFW